MPSTDVKNVPSSDVKSNKRKAMAEGQDMADKKAKMRDDEEKDIEENEK